MKEAIRIIKDREGLYLNAYPCPVGKWTIGWGTTRYPNGRPVRPADTLKNVQEAEELLANDLKIAGESIDRVVKVPLNSNQRQALLSFVHNFGGTKFANSSLLKLLNQGNYAAAAGQLPLWVWGTKGTQKKKLPGLIIRRNMEYKLFNTPC